VGTAGETFAIPQIGVVELVRITEEQRHLVEVVHGAEFYRLRETLLPLVRLGDQLHLGSSVREHDGNIIVCQVGELRFGLVVDEVFDTQEIVVKPVGRLVKHLTTYAGCTITGDGRVIMILDTAGIASAAAVSSRTEDSRTTTATDSAQQTSEDTESVLLFDAGFPALQAVPLSQVSRLEEFTRDLFEEADGRVLVQYRGSLMPILPANPSMHIAGRDPRPVIVFNNGTGFMGIAVDEIRDIIDSSLAVQRAGTRPGVLGVTVMAGRAAEIVDLEWFFREAAGRRAPSLTPVQGNARIAA
jgi:two-component system chemotaxis sensor kinase CheA